jgi:hypothetical protein
MLSFTLTLGLFSDLDFQTMVYDRHDSQPPICDEKNDHGVTLGLSWSH